MTRLGNIGANVEESVEELDEIKDISLSPQVAEMLHDKIEISYDELVEKQLKVDFLKQSFPTGEKKQSLKEVILNAKKSVKDKTGISRRDFLKTATAVTASVVLPSTLSAEEEVNSSVALIADLDKRLKSGEVLRPQDLKDLFEKAQKSNFISSKNEKTLQGGAYYFGATVGGSFAGGKLDTVLDGINATFLKELLAVTPASGLTLSAFEAWRIDMLKKSENVEDQKMGHHESHEFYGNMYLVLVMSFLADFAEQKIQVSPQIDEMMENQFTTFNTISGGYQLKEQDNRPEYSEKAEYIEHFKKAENDFIKAQTDLLVYSVGSSVIAPVTVYATSTFANASKEKMAKSGYEYFLSAAILGGKTEDEAKKFAIEESNKANNRFMHFKLTFIDNVIAGLGVDGPCIPVFLKLYEAGGVNAIINYYTMMIPNIMKYSLTGMTQILYNNLVSNPVDNKSIIDRTSPYLKVLTQGIGEVLWNGSLINISLLMEMKKQISQKITARDIKVTKMIKDDLGELEGANNTELFEVMLDSLGKEAQDTPFQFSLAESAKEFPSVLSRGVFESVESINPFSKKSNEYITTFSAATQEQEKKDIAEEISKISRNIARNQTTINRSNNDIIIKNKKQSIDDLQSILQKLKEKQDYINSISSEEYTRTVKAARNSFEQHRNFISLRTAEEKNLTNQVRTTLLNRFSALKTWKDGSVSERRDVLESLIEHDITLQNEMKKNSHLNKLLEIEGVDEELHDEQLHSLLFQLLGRSIHTKSDTFKSFLIKENGQKRYTKLTKLEYATCAEKGLGLFIKDYQLQKDFHVEGHREAGLEVFGALSGQLTAAALMVSLVGFLSTKKIKLSDEYEDRLLASLDSVINNTENSELVSDVLRDLLKTVNAERGELSPLQLSKLDEEFIALDTEIHKYLELRNSENNKKPEPKDTIGIIKQSSNVLADIFKITRMEELSGQLGTIYTAGAIGTPVADNIAAVLFMIASGQVSIEEIYGEEILNEKISLPIFGLDPITGLAKEMTIKESLIIIAAMLGINLGNGTLFGNGVQLAEKKIQVKKSNSSKIGDLDLEEVNVTDDMLGNTVFTNPYSRLADMWTAIDVYKLLSFVTKQINEKGPQMKIIKKEKVRNTEHH